MVDAGALERVILSASPPAGTGVDLSEGREQVDQVYIRWIPWFKSASTNPHGSMQGRTAHQISGFIHFIYIRCSVDTRLGVGPIVESAMALNGGLTSTKRAFTLVHAHVEPFPIVNVECTPNRPGGFRSVTRGLLSSGIAGSICISSQACCQLSCTK